ncbi:rhombosortase [Psychromonas arctica]|uniref:rhombosortase n=1 Tax=Psychromonas arctica TaxID=168275 RepID=UPI000491ABDD|nr:rhombosortase [Psychromonas arctica]
MRSVLFNNAIILTLCLLVFFLQPDSHQWFAYYHSGIEKGQWWRLLTAHICHTNGYHFLLNAVGLVVVSTLFLETFKKISLLAASLFSALFISTCLFLLEPDLQWYVGLSGVLHAIFAIGVCDELKKADKWGLILAVGFLIKIAFEQFNGPSLMTESLIAATVLVNAHLYGAIAGILYFLMMPFWKKCSLRQNNAKNSVKSNK